MQVFLHFESASNNGGVDGSLSLLIFGSEGLTIGGVRGRVVGLVLGSIVAGGGFLEQDCIVKISLCKFSKGMVGCRFPSGGKIINPFLDVEELFIS